jgi:hypothetical protein
MERSQWVQEVNRLLEHPPVKGDYLRTRDGSLVKVEIDLQPGSEPFVFSRIYLCQIFAEDPGWFARGINDSDTSGWRCILMPRARKELIQRFGVGQNAVGVKMLRVVKGSETHRSLQVEVASWE